MQSKKSPKANLENKRPVFFMAGLAMALLAAITVFEYTSVNTNITVIAEPTDGEEVVYAPRTVWEKPEKPKQQETQKEQRKEEAKIFDLDKILEITDNPLDEGEEPEIFDEPYLKDVDPSAGEEEGDAEPLEYFAVDRMAVPYECAALVKKDEQMVCLNDYIKKYISKNVRYPQSVIRRGIGGKMYVNFTFDTDGTIYAATITRGLDDELDEEVLRVIKELPTFRPAGVLNHNVKMKMTLPISFKF